MALVSGQLGETSGGAGLNSISKAVGPLPGASNLPLYQQLQRALARRHRSQASSAPTMRCRRNAISPVEFGVSRITVRKAIDGLVNEGLLMRRHGSGTFVRGRVEKNFSMLTSFSEDMRARGRTPRSDWLKRSTRHRHARGIANAALEPGHAGVPLPPAALRGRRADVARVRDRHRRPACRRSMRSSPRCTRRSSAPATAPCARCSGCARCC